MRVENCERVLVGASLVGEAYIRRDNGWYLSKL